MRYSLDKYEVGPTFIKIKYKRSNDVYVYTFSVPGEEVVKFLINTAIKGESGLSIYLSGNKYLCEYIEEYKDNK